MQVMESRCGLNQRLQKILLRLLQSQPNAFPMFVREPELLIAIAAEAFGKRVATPVERHSFSISEAGLIARDFILGLFAALTFGPLVLRQVHSSPSVRTQQVRHDRRDDRRAGANELGHGVERGIRDPDISGAINGDAESEIQPGLVAGGG